MPRVVYKSDQFKARLNRINPHKNAIYLMSITRGVLAQSPEPEAHDKVLDNNPDRIGIWKCWFLRRGENRSNRRKTSRSKDENQQQTHT